MFSSSLTLDVLKNKTVPWEHLQSLVDHTARKFLLLLILNFLLLNFIPLSQVYTSCTFQAIPSFSVCLYSAHTCSNCLSPVIISLPQSCLPLLTFSCISWIRSCISPFLCSELSQIWQDPSDNKIPNIFYFVWLYFKIAMIHRTHNQSKTKVVRHCWKNYLLLANFYLKLLTVWVFTVLQNV